MYYNVSYKKYLKRNQWVLVRNEEWSGECPFYVCQWHYGKFIFNEEDNDLFNEGVIAFVPLDENGYLTTLNM